MAPPFENLVRIDGAALSSTLREMWDYIKDLENKVVIVTAEADKNANLVRELQESDQKRSQEPAMDPELLEELNAMIELLRADVDELKKQREADAQTIAALNDRLDGVEHEFGNYQKSLEAMDAKIDTVAESNSLSDELIGLKAKLQSLAPDLQAIAAAQGRIDSNAAAIADLRNRLDHLTIDDLVEQKAIVSHLAIEEDDGQIHHYESGTPVEDVVVMRGRRGSSVSGDPAGASGSVGGNGGGGGGGSGGRGGGVSSRGSSPDADSRPGSRLSVGGVSSEAAGGEGTVLNTSGGGGSVVGGGGGGGGPISQRRTIRRRDSDVSEVALTAAAGRRSPLERATASSEASDRLLHSYAALNQLVNEHTLAIAELADVQRSILETQSDIIRHQVEPEVVDGKADLLYCDNIFSLLNDKFKQLAEVSNRNVDVLGRICNAKADLDDVDSLKSELTHIMDEDVGLAAGKVHFRCLSCDRGSRTMAGPMSERFRLSTINSIEGGSPAVTYPPSSGEPTVLYGTDSQVYRGRQSDRLGSEHVRLGAGMSARDVVYDEYYAVGGSGGGGGGGGRLRPGSAGGGGSGVVARPPRPSVPRGPKRPNRPRSGGRAAAVNTVL